MAYSFGNNGLIICHNTIRYNGVVLPNPPRFQNNNHNVTQIDNRLYINGYEWKDGKWKRTLKALWYLIF
jgi:hypothetical protein